MPQPRSLVTCVVLSVITCGIYMFVWLVQLGGDIQMLRGDEKPPVVRDLLLTLVTCGLWSFFVAYQWPIWLQETLAQRGRKTDPNLPTLSVVLNLFGLQLVPLILMQQVLNEALLDSAFQTRASAQLNNQG